MKTNMKKLVALLIIATLLLPLFTGIGLAASAPSAWAAQDIARAREAGIITEAVARDFTANITREQFAELVVKLYESLTGNITTAGRNPFTDTNNPEVVKAFNLGLVYGVSATRFDPHRNIPRQEVCVMLVRCIALARQDVDVHVFNSNTFADIGSIASWALPSVQFAFDNGIIRGVGGNRINPLGSTTCEQAVLLAFRVYLEFRDTTPSPHREVYAAYHVLLTRLISEYGISETAFDLDGLFKATLVDFDNDGIDELIFYYAGWHPPVMRSGYVVYGYDQSTGSALLIHDHRDEFIEPMEVSVFRGQDGNVYVKNRFGQSIFYWGDFSTLEDGTWKTAMTWEERWNDRFTVVTYTIDGVGSISETVARQRFQRFEAELIFDFKLFDPDVNLATTSNIMEVLQDLARRSA